MITPDVLDSLAQTDFDQVDPAEVADRLITAVDEGRIAQAEDIGYALSLAAQLLSDAEDDRALAIAERALAEERDADADTGPTRALRGQLLVQAGRTDEGMAEFVALRPRLVEDPLVAEYLTDALVAAALPEVAELWLDDAAGGFADALGPDTEPDPAAVEILYAIIHARLVLREELGRETDDLDELAIQLEAEVADATDFELDRPAVLFWTEPEWKRLSTLMTGLEAWDAHRTGLERRLQEIKDVGPGDVALVAGSVDELSALASQRGEPIAKPLVERYAGTFTAADGDATWPPGRNEPCWCGSGQKYKRCCLARARG
jgi:SEC-C motif-containing protein